MQEFAWHTCQLQNAVTVSGLHTAFIETFEPSFAGHMEKHNFWELVAVLDGEVCVETEGQTVCLKNGQMILHPPMELHRHFNCSMKRNTFAVLSFDAVIALKEAAGIYHLNIEQKQQIPTCERQSGIFTYYDSPTGENSRQSQLLRTGAGVGNEPVEPETSFLIILQSWYYALLPIFTDRICCCPFKRGVICTRSFGAVKLFFSKCFL